MSSHTEVKPVELHTHSKINRVTLTEHRSNRINIWHPWLEIHSNKLTIVNRCSSKYFSVAGSSFADFQFRICTVGKNKIDCNYHFSKLHFCLSQLQNPDQFKFQTNFTWLTSSWSAILTLSRSIFNGPEWVHRPWMNTAPKMRASHKIYKHWNKMRWLNFTNTLGAANSLTIILNTATFTFDFQISKSTLGGWKAQISLHTRRMLTQFRKLGMRIVVTKNRQNHHQQQQQVG